MDQIKIGKFIAERRKERGFLQKDIAAKLGISEKTVSKWECGNGLPEVIYMEPLCRILGITVNELLAGESIPILKLMSFMDLSRLELVKQLEFNNYDGASINSMTLKSKQWRLPKTVQAD